MEKYSKELIEGVARLYPDSEVMNRFAKEGNPFLGRYLDDGSSSSIDIDCILQQHHIDGIHAKAKELKAKRDLYALWYEDYKTSH